MCSTPLKKITLIGSINTQTSYNSSSVEGRASQDYQSQYVNTKGRQGVKWCMQQVRTGNGVGVSERPKSSLTGPVTLVGMKVQY